VSSDKGTTGGAEIDKGKDKWGDSYTHEYIYQVEELIM
jgi:hypothetical protein